MLELSVAAKQDYIIMHNSYEKKKNYNKYAA